MALHDEGSYPADPVVAVLQKLGLGAFDVALDDVQGLAERVEDDLHRDDRDWPGWSPDGEVRTCRAPGFEGDVVLSTPDARCDHRRVQFSHVLSEHAHVVGLPGSTQTRRASA